MNGKVYLVGAGPGDPDLITVKGMRVLEQADCIVYDRLVSRELVNEAPEHAERIFCGKWSGLHAMKQEEIQLLLVEKAREGKTVVRLKGGDPSMFGRVGEEAETCAAAGVPFEIVPGITAGTGAAAYAGIPLTHREYSSSVTFVTGHCCSDNSDVQWHALAHAADTIVVYMGVKQLPVFSEKLINAGRSADTPVAFIEQGTTHKQRTIRSTLGSGSNDAAAADLQAPALVVIGEVAALHDTLSWFEKPAAPFEQVV
ncbi:uroporphyrinogen-III C-methyltransferase [Alkalicoccus luteus]|uniref:Uroporphyrinogen-III C-methyltransferase n=1 Tax=Alkalicoccus luteus TaxID=1237094 RepID=A0A969TWH7_9BACI|nr:uroporphyrinogen-III C-methyltransferase [Alkalicoccus luteus]NJP39081.1 uroporphyrinogen-III C-methyltransferase [Alkalicoccus luteus]